MTLVRYELDGGIAWITLDRPEAMNALNRQVRSELWSSVRRFAADPDARVLVVTGSGDAAFCAGADLKEMSSTGMEIPPPDFLPMFGRNIDMPKPTIAAVNGVAFGGGFLLAQYCDLCIAADGARFAISEARVGRGAPWAASLPWLIPPRVALELMMTAAPITAQRAHEIGLVNSVVTGQDLRERAGELARTIAANAPLSVKAAKAMVYQSLSLEALFDKAERIWAPVYLSSDAQEGPAAFREGRVPRWQGR